VPARAADSVSVALLAVGVTTTRATPVSGAPRGPFCIMGACFDCLAEVDGRANVQTMHDARARRDAYHPAGRRSDARHAMTRWRSGGYRAAATV
jgi:hypothetical protein